MPDIRVTPELDDFSIPEEELGETDGRWMDVSKAGPGYMTTLNIGGVATANAIASNGDQLYFWTKEAFKGDCEAWGLIYEYPEITEGWRIGILDAGSFPPTAGFQLLMWDPIGSAPVWQIRAYGGGTIVSVEQAVGWGDLILVRVKDGVFETFICEGPGGIPGPPADGENWTLVASTGWPYGEAKYLALGTATDDPDEGWSSFGGGLSNRTQIYRYVSN